MGGQEDQRHGTAGSPQGERAAETLPHGVRAKQPTAVAGECTADVEVPGCTVPIARYQTDGDTGVGNASIATFDGEAGLLEDLLGQFVRGLARASCVFFVIGLQLL